MAKPDKSSKPSKTTRSAKTDRQRLIEDSLKKQRSGDKRRGGVIIGAAVLVAAAIVAVPIVPRVVNAVEEDQYADQTVEQVGADPSVCQDIETKEATGVSDHVPEGTPVTYDVAPPAYGAHWNVANVAPATFDRKFYTADDRPPLEALVHNLEHGYTILWYDETAADQSSTMAQIRAVAKKFDGDADNANFRLKFIAAPWLPEDEDGKAFPDGQHIAFTHWKGDAEKSTGVWQYCSEFSGQALTDFMDEYPYTDAPEAGAI